MKLDFNFSFAATLLACVLGAGHAAGEAAGEAPEALRGKVLDLSGAAVAGATVTAVVGETSAAAVTDAAGGFVVEGLPAGAARIRVTSPGFATFEARRQDRAAVTVVPR